MKKIRLAGIRIIGRFALHGFRHSWNSLYKRTREYFRFWHSLKEYERLAPAGPKPEIAYLYPCLYDNTGSTPIDASYYYQDAWAFEKIFISQPPWHLDIGSHHKFVSLLSKVVATTMVDLRPPDVMLDSLKFMQGSILALPFPSGSVPSVSSLCVIEHIGLGRYGDPLDPAGSIKALAELQRVVSPGGDLYVSVPIDNVDRIYFNAHRAFAEESLLRLFQPFEVLERKYIFANEFGSILKEGFGTGCYHLRKPL